MHDQATAPTSALPYDVRESRYRRLVAHYRIAGHDIPFERERWASVAVDRGEYRLTGAATFEDLCADAGIAVLDDGHVPVAAYDLDTGEAVELHVSTPIVSRSEEQGVTVHPSLTAGR